MEYSIQELSRLSGVTTRALRWYDKIGLLKPSGRTEGGYRRYGPAEVDASNARIMGAALEQFQEYERLGQEILDKLSAAVAAGADPAGASGQEVADLHRRWLTIMGDKYDVRRHRGIAELYVQDERFTAYYDRERPGCARFLRDAVLCWVK